MKLRAPNFRCVGSGSHWSETKKRRPFVRRESHDRHTRTTTRAARRTRTRAAAAWHRRRKAVSFQARNRAARRGGPAAKLPADAVMSGAPLEPGSLPHPDGVELLLQPLDQSFGQPGVLQPLAELLAVVRTPAQE